MRKITLLSLFLLIFLLACNSGKTNNYQEQQAAAKKPASPEYLTGRSAFQKLYVAAHAFAADVKPYRMESNYTPGSPAQEGKSALWRAQFASPSRRSIKAFSWSGLTGPDAPDPGISHGSEDTYNPSNTSTQVFDVAFLKTDSDAAFKVAQEHGGEKLTKKDPNQPVFYTLEFDARASQLIWHVIYGTNTNDAKLNVAVDATSGKYLRTEH